MISDTKRELNVSGDDDEDGDNDDVMEASDDGKSCFYTGKLRRNIYNH